jgi:hypothetical protein
LPIVPAPALVTFTGVAVAIVDSAIETYVGAPVPSLKTYIPLPQPQ